MNRRSYPVYKSSGVEWLGNIPNRWRQVSLKYVARFMYGDSLLRADDGDEGRFQVFGSNGPYATFSQVNTRSPAIVIGRKGSYGKVNWTKEACFASDTTFFVDETTTQQHLRWLFYVFQTLDLDKGTDEAAVPGLNRDNAYERKILVPPLPEQRSIAAFLDHKTTRIDALIEKKQRQIELLQEKRTALISHAVTKGLDPNVNMKDSGVEWLGKIPEHWRTKRLKFVADISTGGKDTENSVEDGEYPFFVRSQTVERIDSYSFDGEAVLTAGDGVGVAKVFHYINGKFDFHQRVYKFSNFQSISGKFFFYYIHELFREEVLKLSAKSTVDSLRLPMIQDFVFCFPTLAEQAELVEHLERETTRIEALIEKVEKSLVLLREWRTSLISAAVTGKIDIRKEAA